MAFLSEAELETALLTRLAALGYACALDEEIGPDGKQSERDAYDEVVLEAFEGNSGPLLRKSMFVCKESRALAQLRDTPLPKITSGEIRVKDAESFLKERGL